MRVLRLLTALLFDGWCEVPQEYSPAKPRAVKAGAPKRAKAPGSSPLGKAKARDAAGDEAQPLAAGAATFETLEEHLRWPESEAEGGAAAEGCVLLSPAGRTTAHTTDALTHCLQVATWVLRGALKSD